MTKQELNRDIKRLYNKFDKLAGDDFYKFVETEGQKEFKRLYYADSEADYLNKTTLLMMMNLNRRYRYIQFHTFYINAEI